MTQMGAYQLRALVVVRVCMLRVQVELLEVADITTPCLNNTLLGAMGALASCSQSIFVVLLSPDSLQAIVRMKTYPYSTSHPS